MNRKYVLHPRDYAIGENEKLYSDMAAKGWLLQKRGAFLSRFNKAEPQHLRYRIELSTPAILKGEIELPDEQLALYEESGWSFVTGRIRVHVFSAPEGSDIPEIYTDPRQQAATLKGLRRRYYFSWIQTVLILMINLLFPVLTSYRGGNVLENLFNTFRMGWIAYTALFLLISFATLWAAYATVYGAVRIAQLHRRLKRGQPIDHAPKRRHLFHRVVNGVLLFCVAASVVLTIMQWARNTAYAMPLDADGPYLLLKDLGWDEGRSTMLADLTSNVKTKHSLLADQWFTYECVTARGRHSWMYQDIYILPDEKLAGNMLPWLMTFTIFTRGASEFTRVDVEGLDMAYVGHMEYLAAKGNTVYFIRYSDPDVYAEQGTQVDVLAKLAEMLK